MSVNKRISTVLANARLDGAASMFNSGKILIYDGTQPATPETSVTTQNLLVTLSFASPAFFTASNKSATANLITQGTAIYSSNASWCRITKSDGTVLMDGSVGTTDANIILNSTVIVSGAVVSCSSFADVISMQGS